MAKNKDIKQNNNGTKSGLLPDGRKAPGFQLPAGTDKRFRLKELRGKPVVLVFYPADWSPVCSDQLALYSEIYPEFESRGAQLVGISVDSVWSHQAFIEARGIKFPLLSDFQPRGKAAKKYKVYRKEDGLSERAIYVIDKDGMIFWSYLSPMSENPGADGILKALDAMNAEDPPKPRTRTKNAATRKGPNNGDGVTSK